MEYNRYLYKIDKDFIKLEKGIIWKKYTSIPYEKVQNINIKRGIIARMCGFSTVDIETAGQSGYGGHYNGWSYSVGNFKQGNNKGYQSEGYLPAIDLNEAEEIRKFIMKRVKNTSDEAV
jgi:membrane protein YdbS with pleckstrin-like domain